MRAQDIVNQLAVYLPALVDDFTVQFAVTSLTRSGTTVTAVTSAPHGLVVGRQVNITGAKTPIPCTLARSGIIGSATTTTDHDLTEQAGFEIELEGSIEAEFNGSFKLLSVRNRREFTFLMDDSGPIVATGAPLLMNGFNVFRDYNGLREIDTVPTATSFTYEITDATLFTPAGGTIVAKIDPRISASVDFERLMEEYTKQPSGEAWLFVVVGDAIASKNRGIDTDATDNIQAGNYFNQKLIQSIFLYVFLPTSEQIAGRAARDRCEELLSPICQSILGVKFPSLVENDNNPLMLTGHGIQAYNKAFYAHQYGFEVTLQLGPTDIFVPTDDVAFRDINLTMGSDLGNETFDTLIDLDDNPL